MLDELAVIVQKQSLERVAYARLSADLTLLEASPNWLTFLPPPTRVPRVGQKLADCFPEFFGLEDYIHSIMDSKRPLFQLERINRPISTGGTAYFDFAIVPVGESEDLLLTIEDTTSFGLLEQSLVQERNELRLTRRELAKVNEALQRLDQLKAVFFSMAAHDLRSPLMTVRGYADLLGMMVRQRFDDEDKEQAMEFVDTIRVQADWLDQLIHNILDLNRIESDRFVMQKEFCNANDLSRHAADALRPMATLGEQTIDLQLHKGGILLKADSQRIEQCVNNLIVNAIKYTPSQGVITVTTTQTESHAEIIVADTGRGVAAEQLAHIFDLYYRTDDAARSEISGTGLGLYVVRHIVEAHEGTIGVTSELGKGTCFKISLPRSLSLESD